MKLAGPTGHIGNADVVCSMILEDFAQVVRMPRHGVDRKETLRNFVFPLTVAYRRSDHPSFTECIKLLWTYVRGFLVLYYPYLRWHFMIYLQYPLSYDTLHLARCEVRGCVQCMDCVGHIDVAGSYLNSWIVVSRNRSLSPHLYTANDPTIWPGPFSSRS